MMIKNKTIAEIAEELKINREYIRKATRNLKPAGGINKNGKMKNLYDLEKVKKVINIKFRKENNNCQQCVWSDEINKQKVFCTFKTCIRSG